MNFTVTIAGEDPSIIILKKEFPNLEFLPLKGYQILYPKNGLFFILKITSQIPKILRAIYNENKWLNTQLKDRMWDLIISDNRYGLYTKKTKTVFITHQIHIISGFGNIPDTLLQRIVYNKINKFNMCWIPDVQDEVYNIGGKLSHPIEKPHHTKFIGPLSRLEIISNQANGPILILLSGPEPQRTVLENILLKQLNRIQNEKIIFVRGLPESTTKIKDEVGIQFINFIDVNSLSKIMSEASLVICRSGYSTIMDLIKLNKKALLIPTPGQSEQLYLANHLQKMNRFIVRSQETVSLAEDINTCRNSSATMLKVDFAEYKNALREIVEL